MTIYDRETGKKRSAKQKPKDVNGTAAYNNSVFVQFELTAEQKAECKAWELDIDQLDALLLKLLDSYYRVSAKWDDFSNSYAAYLQTTDAGHENFGLILAGRGSTPAKAIKQVLYKHFKVLAGEYSRWVDERKQEEIDD
jgi:hypothetical protein